MSKTHSIKVPFPVKGFQEATGYRSLPADACPDCLNVRPFDAGEDKLRGGTRAGTSKYLTSQPSGTDEIDAIAVVSTGQKAGGNELGSSLYTDDFSYYRNDSLDAAMCPHTIASVPQSDQVTISGDVTDTYTASTEVYLYNGDANAKTGYYTVSSSSYSSGDDATTVTLSGTPGLSATEVGAYFGPAVYKFYDDSGSVTNHISDTFPSIIDYDSDGTMRQSFPSGITTAHTVCQTAVGNDNYRLAFELKMSPNNQDYCDCIVETRFDGAAPDGTDDHVNVIIRGGVAGVTNLDLVYVDVDHGGTSLATATWESGTDWDAGFKTVHIDYQDNTVQVTVDGHQMFTSPVSIAGFGNSCTKFAFDGSTNSYGAGSEWWIDDIAVTSIYPASMAIQRYMAVASGGDVYVNQEGETGLSSTSATVGDGRDMTIIGAYNKFFVVDGTQGNYTVVDPAAGTSSSWVATYGVLPAGYGNTTNDITGIASSSEVEVSGDVTSTYTADSVVSIQNSTDNDGTYTVSSSSHAAGTTTITITPAQLDTTTADGTIGTASYGAKYGCLYRGRLVLYGVKGMDQNWHMSAVNDPYDWDYFPTTTTSTMAVVGNNSDAGEIGDTLTCCLPYSDDLLFMGCADSIYVMRGDPADQGRIDLITDRIGVKEPTAATFDPYGRIFFFGNGELWRMDGATALPQSISRNRIRDTFDTLDDDAYRCSVIWDTKRDGLWIFFTSGEEPTTAETQFFWDSRTDSFWKDEYPAAAGPHVATSVGNYESFGGGVALGGYDGYIRYIDDSATTDADTSGTSAITSELIWAPLTMGTLSRTLRIEETRLMMADISSQVNANLEIYGAENEHAAVDAAVAGTSPSWSRSVSTDRAVPVKLRLRRPAICYRIDATSAPWAMEAMEAFATEAGRQRVRE